MRKLTEAGGRLARTIAFAVMIAVVALATISPVRAADGYPWAMLRIGQVAELSGIPTGIYHEKGMRWYGRTKHGAYACRKEANAAGYWDAENGQ